MSLSVTRLRRWFAAAAIVAVFSVAGVYFYARHRVQNALKQVPEKIGVEIKQTATGFTISKSEQGRTLFKVEASKAVQFQQGGRAELHDVAITLYGHDSTRYDRIYGSDFVYDQQTGNVTASGEVQIDLEANPEGLLNPDQSPPKDLKNPIHLKTSGLVFNQKSGDAFTKNRVDFTLAGATGSAMGVNYIAQTNVLTLESNVKVSASSLGGASLTAIRGTIATNPHQVILDQPQLNASFRHCQSDRAVLFLRPDNTIDHIFATENVLIRTDRPPATETHADQLDLVMAKQSQTPRSAILSGNVTLNASSAQPVQASAGHVIFDFAAKNRLTKVHAEENVKLLQHQSASKPSASAQDLELAASVMDFFLSKSQHLARAETVGSGQLTLRPAGSGNGTQTVVTAGKFDAKFDDLGQLASVHGTPDARIVNRNPSQPDRVSTSQMVDATFHPGQGIDSVVQQGDVAYEDGDRKAWGQHARYTPSDQILLLTGSPRVTEGGMTTTARSMRFNRATSDATAGGDVKSTYSDLTQQPNGALLASSSPIHVTARSMTVHGASAIALYTGDVRLWQDANVVTAPAIDFDRDHRSMVARGSASDPVSTVLVETDKNGVSTPVALTSTQLMYTDSERKAHFDEDVTAKSADATITAKEIDAFLLPRGSSSSNQANSGGKLEKIVADGQVVIIQPGRQGTGDRMVYTSADDKFVLTGGPPSIFDAEHGKITGVSLTFFRRDDRVLVEGNSTSPAVTQTRVAR
ncbi:MAG TPA: LPS export ABC transporter periplasmic protein LptC [Terriglobales bacterium]|nr:LPS export ABC transporter periplasmic protein LptC [Terriglobales bacterium]